MSAISLKSITGITSITTPTGVDNQLTLHNNNTSEAVKLDVAGNLHFHNHLNITGVSTASNFKTGTSNLHNTGLNVQDLDVDGHTNLDNVSVAGVSTFSGNINLPDSVSAVFGTDDDGSIKHTGTNLQIFETTGNIQITNYANDKDVVISSDDGSGGTTSYFTADGSTGKASLSYYGSTKLTTDTAGVDITGMCTDDGARHDGDVYFIGGTSGRNAVWDMSDDAFEFADNAKAKFGTGNDLQISHTGANSIVNNLTGDLRIESDRIELNNQASNEFYLTCTANGAVELYYDASAHSDAKLLTSEKGIKVGTGVTIETNGQATYVGIVTASAFKLSDGSNVGGVESDAQYNTVGGTNAGDSITSDGINNTAFGYNAITAVTEGDDNTAVGFEAGLQANASTFKNTFIGSRAGRNVTTGTRNTYIGYDAGRSTSNKSTNVCIGYNSGLSVDGSDVVSIGNGAGENSHDGTVSIGAYSGGNVSGINQVFIGYNCGKDLTGNSSKNTLVGYSQFGSNSGARDNNTGVGYGAAWKCQGDNNTFVGTETLENALGAANNSVFGYKAGDLITTGDNNIVIGASADPSSATVSNEITLGDANITKFRIPGIGCSISEGGAVITGIVTATSFAGDGSALTGLSGVSVANQADNRLITATGTTDALNGEANLTFDGSTLTADGDVLFKSTTSGREVLWDKSLNRMIHRTNARASFGNSSQLEMWHNGSSVGYIMQGADGYLRIDGNDGLHFYTKPSGGSTTERLRIDSNGNVGINETSPQQQLHVHDDSNYNGILINGNSAPRIAFAKNTTTTGEWSVGVDGTNGAQFVINNSNDNSNRKLIISSSEVSIANNAVVGGNLTASGYIDSSSDIKLKTNIKTIDNALDKVLQLRGAEYDRIDRDNEHEIGVIAQEVEKIIPEVVHGDETKTVSYGNLVGLLIEAVKDLKKEIDELKSS